MAALRRLQSRAGGQPYSCHGGRR